MNAQNSALNGMTLIGRGVFLELTRKREFYVMLIIMGIYLLAVGVVTVVGIENASTATFILNLGMTLSWFIVHLLTILLISRQIPEEIDKRTLYPLLARPVTRRAFVLGKWAAASACGVVCLLVLTLLAWLPVPKMETFHAELLLQLLFLGAISIGMLASIGLLLSLLVPRGITIVLGALLLLFGKNIIALITSFGEGTAAGTAIGWIARYVPNFSNLNLITRYTDGIPPLEPVTLGAVTLYGLIITFFALGMSIFIFERRAL